MWDRILAEPVIIAMIVRQAITLAAAFKFELTAEQTAALIGFVELLTTLLTRAVVTPTRTMNPRP